MSGSKLGPGLNGDVCGNPRHNSGFNKPLQNGARGDCSGSLQVGLKESLIERFLAELVDRHWSRTVSRQFAALVVIGGAKPSKVAREWLPATNCGCALVNDVP